MYREYEYWIFMGIVSYLDAGLILLTVHFWGQDLRFYWKYNLFFILLFGTLIYGSVWMEISVWGRTLFLLLSAIVFFRYCYKASWFSGAISLMIFMAFRMVLEVLLFPIFLSPYWFDKSTLVFCQYNESVLSVALIERVIMFVGLSLSSSNLWEKRRLFPWKLNFVILAAFLTFIAAGNLLFQYSLETLEYTRGMQPWLLFACILLLFFSVGLFYQYLCGSFKAAYENTMLNVALEASQNYAERFQQESENTAKIWHDMMGHIAAMKALYQKQETSSQAALLLENLEKRVYNLAQTVHSGNPLVDAVLTDKMQKARGLNIDFRVRALVPEDLPFPLVDICSLMTNTLDNAIESCINVLGEKSFVSVLFMQQNKELYYIITNSFDPLAKNNFQEKNPFFLKSQPPDLSERKYILFQPKEGIVPGYGMKIVEDIVNRHKGRVYRFKDNETYTIQVILPIPQE